MRHLTAALVLAAGVVSSAQAGLIGVTQTDPRVALSTPYLIYDHNGVNASTGLLRVLANTSTLVEGASNQLQSYLGAGDSIPDLMLTIQVDNTTGAFAGGSVSIGFGNAAAVPRFSWQGAITNFGFQSGTSTIFDATWTMSADQYQNMPGTMSQFVDGYLTGGSGGLKISSSAAWGGGANFANDWIFAANPNSSSIDGFTGGLTSPLRTASNIGVDVFASPVPLPAAVWMLIGGLGVLAPLARRRNARQTGALQTLVRRNE
jgi:hypothetical protein